MPLQLTADFFIIASHNVELMVVLQSDGWVKLEPYQCKEANMRLWAVIAKTQTALAQIQLQGHKGNHPLRFLQTLFQSSGWDVKQLETE